MAAFLTNLNEAQKIELIYVAYFQRAGDGGGYQWWTNQYDNDIKAGVAANVALERVADNFVPQPETLGLYPFLNSPFNPSDPVDQANLSDFIDTVYQHLFNRAPDEAGKLYWTNQIATGTVSVGKAILTIANAAGSGDDQQTKDDAATLMNKIAAGLDFTIRTSAAGQGDAPLSDAFMAAAKGVIDGVDATAQSLTEAKQETTDYLDGKAPTTNYFTTGVDALKGGAGDDNFIADNTGVAKVTQPTDSVDGGAGVNTLTFYGGIGGGLPGTISHIQNIVVDGALSNMNLSTVAGLASLTLQNSVGGGASYALGADTSATLTAVRGGVVTLSHLAADTAAAVKLNGVDGVFVDVTGAGLTAATISSTGIEPISGKNQAGIDTASSVALTFDGTTSLTVTGTLDNKSVTNAMGAETTLKVAIDSSAGDTSYTGGAGKDVVTAFSVLTATDKVDGGGGAADELTLTAAAHNLTGVTGFEKLTIAENGGGGLVAMDLADKAFTNIVVQEDNVQLTNVHVADAVTLDGQGGVSGVNIGYKGFTIGGTDTASISVSDVGAGSWLTSNTVDHLTLKSTGASSGSNDETLNASDLNTLTLTGDKALSLTITAAPGLTSIDASAMTKGLTNLDVFGVGAPTLDITQTAHADTITLGGGVETLIYKAAGDSKVGAFDTINIFTAGAGGDKIDLSAVLGGADKVASISAAATGTVNGTTGDVTGVTGHFFENPVNAYHEAVYIDVGADTFVYIDADGNHDFSASADMVVKLAGVAGGGLITANFG